MTEPQISPLARRLAEENSIDWRVIPGTGPENRVIERDILTYLARIMSGEIDPPALPDASEPPSPGGAAPNLSEVSNLAAASAGMAREGIDLSSLLGGGAPVAAGLAAPIFDAPAPVIPAPVQTTPLDFQAADALPASSLDFTFSDEPIVPSAATQSSSLEQISFGDPPSAVAAEAPISFGDPVLSDPVFSAPSAKLSPSDSIDAEFEIDLDDFDDAPTALEVSDPVIAAPEVSLPEFVAPGFVAPEFSGSQPSAVESPAFELASPDLAFTATPADLTAHQEDLVLDIDSTSEAPLTTASSDMDDDLVMADVSADFSAPELSASEVSASEVSAPEFSTSSEAFNLEPDAFDSLSLESTEIEPVQLEPVQLELTSPTALIAPIEHDDFELDLIDAESLPIELTTPAIPSSEPVFTAASAPLEPDFIAGGAVAGVGGMLVSATHLEPVDAADSRAESVPPESAPSEPIPHVFQPAEEIPAQASAVASSSSVASRFFQGFAVRRHFDASALTKIQHELTQSLNGREVPLAVFLARAAQRNLHTLGIGDTVTLTRLGDTLEPLQVSGLHHSFIEAVQSVARATPGTMQGLLILDASSLGVDDLVLPVSQPVLTLNVKGEYGHLALAGDLPMSKAADFLAHVAQALEIPVSLVI